MNTCKHPNWTVVKKNNEYVKRCNHCNKEVQMTESEILVVEKYFHVIY